MSSHGCVDETNARSYCDSCTNNADAVRKMKPCLFCRLSRAECTRLLRDPSVCVRCRKKGYKTAECSIEASVTQLITAYLNRTAQSKNADNSLLTDAINIGLIQETPSNRTPSPPPQYHSLAKGTEASNSNTTGEDLTTLCAEISDDEVRHLIHAFDEGGENVTNGNDVEA